MNFSLVFIAAFVISLALFTGNSHAQDTDNDGVADSVDNCPNYWNPEQYDADGDSIGNVCDQCTDQDDDGYGDPGFPTNTCPEDNCPGFYNPDQLDTDGDGIGDLCEGLECGDMYADGSVGLADFILMAGYLWHGWRSPASMHIAGTGGCKGINVHDITFSFSDIQWWQFECDDTSDCLPVIDGVVSLDSVHGVLPGNQLVSSARIEFYLRMTGGDSAAYRGLANGFRVYSPTGAEWGRTDIQELVDFSGANMFTNSLCTRLLSMTGSGGDTIALGYADFQWGSGLEPGFDSVTHVIEIGPIPHEYVGGEICLDSCWYPPCGDWMWSYEAPNGYPTTPTWDGPHCFTIVRCCEPRGDIDNNGSDPDIADLVYLVSYMFQEGPAPPCPEKADINGDSVGPDIADLVYLVTFMFQDGPPPAVCE